MRRFRRIAMIALAGACGAVACGAIDAPPQATPPLNRCPKFDCAEYLEQTPMPTCQGGACQVSQQVDYILVVSVPQTSLFAPGQVFAIRSSELFTRATANCKGRSCTVLPPLGNVDGDYVVNPEGALLAGRSLGNASGLTSLPMRVTMRPLWSPLSSDRPSDAADLGLPLETIFASTRIPTYPNPPPGPNGGPSIEYRVSLPAGRYERTIEPIEPFDDAFPPDLQTVTAPASKYDEVRLVTATTALDTFTFPVARDSGNLEGFTAELVDAVSGRRVSTVARLHAGDPAAVVRILRVANAPTRRLDLRLAPPLAQAHELPVLSYAFVGGATPEIRYPALPAPVVIEGSVGGKVLDADAPVPTAATMELESVEIQTLSSAELTENLRLRFVRRVLTDEQGRYSVRLPPGRYKAAITPRTTGRQRGSRDQVVFAQNATEDIRIADSPAVQHGRFLRLRAAARVRGRCRLTDGRLLSDAEFVARPAAVLALPPEAPAARPPSPATYPREASARTDARGAFDLPLDPGRYDMTIKPAPGTRLPWVVMTSRYVGDDPIELGAIAVPAPIAAGLTIHDANDNPIIRAVVRAYAVPTGGTVAVAIGEAMTDGDGRFEMDLAGNPR